LPLGTAASGARSGGRPGLSPVGALVRQHDRDRFQTALFAPARHGEALFALYAFNYEVARVRESVREPMLGQIRLQWWREAIATAYDGGAPRHHQVAEAITDTIRSHVLSRQHFDRLMDARERDLDDTPPATLAELEDYAEGTSARLVMLALEVLAAATPASVQAARHVGVAYALAGLLRALPVHAAAGRSFIPDEVAAAAGLGPADLRSSPALREAVRTIAAAASRHLAAARALRRALPRAALPALLPACIAANALRRLERAGFDPFQTAATSSDPLQSWRLAYAMLVRRF
jgi:NADH dehydrogenase [ubiquinone] 1 alpha subcomplex assembly factor 6